mgnify:CR=1 FL=1
MAAYCYCARALYISTVILGIQATLEPDCNAVKWIAAQKKAITAVHYLSTNKTSQARYLLCRFPNSLINQFKANPDI